MANLLYARPSDNVAPSAAVITASAPDADPDYAAASIVDLDPAKPSKLTTTTGNWVFDFGTAQRVDVAAIIHHNLTAGLEVRIQGHATDAWGAPSFNQPIVIPAYHEDGFPACPFLDLTTLAGYSAGGFRFWRLVVVGTNAAAIAIGEVLLLALKRSVEVNLSWGATEEEEHPLIEHRTDHGVSSITGLGTTWRELAGDLDTTDAGWQSVRSLRRDARGRARGWLAVPDPTLNDALFVRFLETRGGRVFTFLDRNGVAFRLQEVSRGLPL